MDKIFKFIRKIFVFPLWFYKKFISPFFPTACIYKPTCSEYMKEAILRYGILKGFTFGLLRLLRCNPFFKGGEDTLEETKSLLEALGKYRKFFVFRKQ